MGRWVHNTPDLKRFLAASILCSWIALSFIKVFAAPNAPINASDYHLVFFDDFRDANSVALDGAANPRAKWFRARFFGEGASPSSMLSFQDGILTLAGTTQQSAQIQTASPSSDNNEGWTGRAFRNGAYFEARIAIGADRFATESAWPSFWSMAIEHMPLRGGAQWRGQPPGYMRFVENDFFEYNPRWNRRAYYTTIWEWYGRWELCGKGRWCDQSNKDDPDRVIPLPTGKHFSSFNIYAQKWVPALGKQRGYIQNYLNGRPVGPKLSWHAGDAMPPSSGDLRFNIIDRQGLMVVLTSGGQPMRVDWVRVWQRKDGRLEQR
jgi:hypothetical protein